MFGFLQSDHKKGFLYALKGVLMELWQFRGFFEASSENKTC